MKKVFLFLVLAICPIFFYGQHRVQISYDIPEPDIVSWNSDSIAPFKIVDGYLQRVDVLQCPGKSKDEIFNGVFSFIVNRVGNLKNFVQDKDREAGKITVSWINAGLLPTSKITALSYDCSRVMTIEVKEGRMRIISNMHKLKFTASGPEYTIVEAYPLSPPRKKKPNYFEKRLPRIILLEMLDIELLIHDILESVSRETDDW